MFAGVRFIRTFCIGTEWRHVLYNKLTPFSFTPKVQQVSSYVFRNPITLKPNIHCVSYASSSKTSNPRKKSPLNQTPRNANTPTAGSGPTDNARSSSELMSMSSQRVDEIYNTLPIDTFQYGFSKTEVDTYVKSENGKRLLSMAVADESTLIAQEGQQIVKPLKRHDKDCGSSEVQIAQLTARILALTRHLQVHRHDFVTKRSIQLLVHARRRLMCFLKRSNLEIYVKMLNTLKLRPLSSDYVEDKSAPKKTRPRSPTRSKK